VNNAETICTCCAQSDPNKCRHPRLVPVISAVGKILGDEITYDMINSVGLDMTIVAAMSIAKLSDDHLAIKTIKEYNERTKPTGENG